MGFAAQTSGTSWCSRRPARETNDGPALFSLLEGRTARSLLEIGPGRGTRAAALLQRFPDLRYVAFEPNPGLLRVTRSAIAPFGARASSDGRDPTFPLPEADASHDAALCLDLLEYLRMDQLYMTLNELRRTLRPGALCALRSLSPAPDARGRTAIALRSLALRRWPALVNGARPLELNHYISPEDWKVVDERRAPEGWFTRQSLLLERL